MNTVNLLGKVKGFIISPRFATMLGVAVATMQLVHAFEEMRRAPRSQKRIGFDE